MTTDSRLANLKRTLLFSELALACAMFMFMEFLGYSKQCCFFFASVKPSSHEHWRKIMKGKYKIICQKSPKIKIYKKLQPLKFTHHQKGQCLYKKSQIWVTNLSTPCSLWMWSHRVGTNYKKTHFQGGGWSYGGGLVGTIRFKMGVSTPLSTWMMVTNFP